MHGMTLQQEKDLKAANLEIWMTQVAPLAMEMMGGHREYRFSGPIRLGYGLENDDAIVSEEGLHATQLIAAGKFEEGGKILQQAFYETCLESACLYLDLDINEIRP